jgi:hypothetical protein
MSAPQVCNPITLLIPVKARYLLVHILISIHVVIMPDLGVGGTGISPRPLLI